MILVGLIGKNSVSLGTLFCFVCFDKESHPNMGSLLVLQKGTRNELWLDFRMLDLIPCLRP